MNKACGRWQKSKKLIPFYLMALPGLLYFLINNYLPMVGLFIAFKNVNYTKGIFGSDWVGLKNFTFLFKTQDAFVITRNTLLYNLGFIVLTLIFGVLLAVLLNGVRSVRMVRAYQGMMLMPYLLSMVIVAYLVYAMLAPDTGFINNTLSKLFGFQPVMWYNEKKWWPFILPVVNTWKQAGYQSVLYYAAIIAIDQTYYEAARIDGASRVQQLFHITLPAIRPVITTMVLLQIGKIFYSDFGLFYQVPMNSGTLFSVTNVIDTYVYRVLKLNGDIGLAAAAGLYQSVVGFALVLLSNWVVRKTDPENALY